MANTLLTTQKITYESLRVLKNELKMIQNVYRGYDDEFGKAGNKIGSTLNVRKPPRFLGRVGQAINLEGVTDSFVPLTLNTQAGVDFEFSSVERKLDLDDFSNRVIKPAMANIANRIDRDGCLLYLATANNVGTPGTVPNTTATYMAAQRVLNDMATPRDGRRVAIIPPVAEEVIIPALQGLFNPTGEISKQYREGRMGTALGFEWFMDQNIVTHEIGPLGGTPAVVGAGQAGNLIATNGWTAAAAKRLNRGDIIQFAGVYAVNPQNRATTGRLQDFVVTEDVYSDGAGNANIPISPGIVPAGQFQNVTATPAGGALISVFGMAAAQQPNIAGELTQQSLAFHPDAFTVAFANLDVPGGVDTGSMKRDPDTGISIRFITQYVATTDQWVSRFDVLYGYAPLYPELAVRINN